MTTIDAETVQTVQATTPLPGRWTIERFNELPADGKRYELIDGVVYMTPAPGTEHQRISIALAARLYMLISQTQLGQVLTAPCDVELGSGITVQPDLLFIKAEHEDIIGPNRVYGAPDLVVEIASPSTARYDRSDKQNIYAAAGVSEYWIVAPGDRMIEVLILQAGSYHSVGVFGGAAVLPSLTLPDMTWKVYEIFQ